jgi:hypothetical protein
LNTWWLPAVAVVALGLAAEAALADTKQRLDLQ